MISTVIIAKLGSSFMVLVVLCRNMCFVRRYKLIYWCEWNWSLFVQHWSVLFLFTLVAHAIMGIRHSNISHFPSSPLSLSLTLCLQAGCKFGGNFMLLILKIDSLSIHFELFSFIHIACCLAYPWYICYACMTTVPYWYKMYFVCWFIHHVVEGFFSSSSLVYFLLSIFYTEPVNHWAQSSTRNAIIW